MAQEYKKYTIKDLLNTFKEAGYPFSKSTIIRWELKGNLIVPKSVTNFKITRGNRKPGAVRQFSMTQMQAIVKEFTPGGSGFYDYRENE